MKNKSILNESTYRDLWDKEQVYAYDPNKSKEETFVIDTPPPTISGVLHIGHVFSYTHTDILARFQRMKGKNVFYPMGWDNNGLPTERRVQNLYNIICDPALSDSKNPKWEELLNRKNQKNLAPIKVSRQVFIQVCSYQTKEDQKMYKKLWRDLGLSVDWEQTYETISPSSQAIAQRSFLDLYKKGFVENRNTPVFWDTQFQTAVAQADMEDRPKKGFYYKIKFKVEEAGEFVIATTRPELLPACVAVVAHPEDERYKKYFHKQAVTPLFSASVPILPSTHADPKKGTGILMVCTFGDMEDVHFWEKQKNLPLKQVIGADGTFKEHSLKGLYVQQARKKIVERLSHQGLLVGEPEPTDQFVKFYEKGDYPLEILPARQWYIKILEHKEALLKQGKKVAWYPSFMRKRYEQWVEGLNQDWCISRQRFSGVPFPVWYPLDKKTQIDYKNPILPYSSFFSPKGSSEGTKKNIDPMSSAPGDWDSLFKQYTEAQRGKTFVADTAVMDTWAVSSLTPQINSAWGRDEERHKKLFPADLRPQAHEIIRTWAFYTIAKSYFHNLKQKAIPWKNAVISGWVMNPDRVKISKSKNTKSSSSEKKNVSTIPSATTAPSFSGEEIIKEYSADAVRYWAGKARLGMDTVYDENMFQTGKKLIIKLHNAFKFVQIQVKGMEKFFDSQKNSTKEGTGSFVTEGALKNSTSMDQYRDITKLLTNVSAPVDRAWLANMLDTHQKASDHLNQFHYSKALDEVEKTFWLFCDNYLELVKGRAYQFTTFTNNVDEQRVAYGCSAVYALDFSMYLFVKMLAPYMPYITEHIWSERYNKLEKGKNQSVSSVHTSLWDVFFTSQSGNFLKMFSVLAKKVVGIKKSKTPLEIVKSSALFNLNSLLKLSFNLLEQIRDGKTKQNQSLAVPVKELSIKMSEKEARLFLLCREDIIRAGHISSVDNIKIEKTGSSSKSPSVSLKL